MHKRKVIVISSDDDLDIPLRATASERSLQTARRRGKKVSEVSLGNGMLACYCMCGSVVQVSHRPSTAR